MQAIPDATKSPAPEHVAPVVVFLASDFGADLSGLIVSVRGPLASMYRMIQTDGVSPKGKMGSPQDLHDRWREIVGEQG